MKFGAKTGEGPFVKVWRGGTRQTNPNSLWAEEVEGVRQEVRESKKGEEKRSHEHGHVDGVKDSLLEPRCVCA